MDSESIAIVSVVFGTPVAIITIVCTYKLLKHWIDRRHPQSNPVQKQQAAKMSSDELSLRAENLQKRLNNLEEILKQEKQPGETT